MKVAILLKEIYSLNAILIKIQMTLLTEREKSILNFIWQHKWLWITKEIQSKKSSTGGITIADFKLYCRAIVIKTAEYWHKIKQADQWNRIDDLDNTHATTAIWLLTGEQKTYVGEKIASSTNGTGKTGYPLVEYWN
jgi:hypothetical protein